MPFESKSVAVSLLHSRTGDTVTGTSFFGGCDRLLTTVSASGMPCLLAYVTLGCVFLPQLVVKMGFISRDGVQWFPWNPR